jgi:hypothetical protein
MTARTCFPLAVFLLLAAPLALTASPAPAPAQAEAEARAADALAPGRLMATVRHLAAPALEGRLAGGPGYRDGARWAARRLAAAGLAPGLSSGYLQPLALEHNRIRRCRFGLVREQGVRWGELGRDYACRGFTGSGRVTAEVVFAGYGLSRPDAGYNDYDGIDVRGKLVLVLKQGPGWAPAGGEGWGDDVLPRVRSRVAAEHGARGLILVTGPERARGDAPIGSVLHGPGEQDEDFPQVHVTRALADALLATSGRDLGALQAEIDAQQAPRSFATGTRARLDVKAAYDPSRRAPNVVAVLEGQDPERKDEAVVVGAHLDHVGRQGEVIYAGANDNASGAAVLLAVAEAMAASERPPARTVVFVLFSGEEQGLLGAKRYVAEPVVPLERTVAMINLDCVGQGSGIHLGGGHSAPRLWQLARSLDEQLDGRTIEKTWWGGGADAQPFFEAGLPTLYVAAADGYRYLHRPTDTPETLDPELLAATARLVHAVVGEVAGGGYEREERAPREAES